MWRGLSASPPSTRAQWLARLPTSDAARVAELQAGALDGTRTRWEVEYALHEGVTLLERGFVARSESGPVRVIGTLSLAGTPRAREVPLGERLQRSEERFRTFVEGIPQLAWQATADGWICFYNQRWYDYTDTTLETMEGWGWIAVHDPHDLPRMLKVFRRALATGEPWEDEFRLRRGSDGMLRWHLSRAMPLRDGEGKIVQWFGTNTDIHDQKLALQERERMLERERSAREAAEENNRAKDEFLAVVSHELRTPLNAILGWTQLLQSPELPDDKRAHALERIEASARQQARLIEDLLDASRIIGGKLRIDTELVDLGRLLPSALESLRPAAQRAEVAVRIVGDAPSLTVQGSATRLQQVVSNLVENAIKFSERGGEVRVMLRRQGREACIEVADDGAGIDPTFAPRLFERFGQADSSTTRRRGGLGLGLSIVRHLVELHRGRVEARSEGLGQGARFFVYLPRQGATGEVPRIDEDDAPRTLRGLEILAIDDDESARDVLGALLLERQATVTCVDSAAAALTVLRTKAVDVVVSDIGMPDVDGYALAQRLRADDEPKVAAVPLVALTAYASIADRERALAEGFDAYLAKPIDSEDLVRVITAALRTRTAT
jgi:PAS domain S-box-containing protein